MANARTVPKDPTQPYVDPRASVLHSHLLEIHQMRKGKWPLGDIAIWLEENQELSVDISTISRFCRKFRITKGAGVHPDSELYRHLLEMEGKTGTDPVGKAEIKEAPATAKKVLRTTERTRPDYAALLADKPKEGEKERPFDFDEEEFRRGILHGTDDAGDSV